MRQVVLPLLLLSASPLVAAPAPFAKPERRSDLSRMQGEWEMVSDKRCYLMVSPRGDKLVWFQVPATATASVTGDRVRWYVNGKVTCEEVIRTDRGNVDLTDVESRLTCLGIYRLAGDVLTIRTSRA